MTGGMVWQPSISPAMDRLSKVICNWISAGRMIDTVRLRSGPVGNIPVRFKATRGAVARRVRSLWDGAAAPGVCPFPRRLANSLGSCLMVSKPARIVRTTGNYVFAIGVCVMIMTVVSVLTWVARSLAFRSAIITDSRPCS